MTFFMTYKNGNAVDSNEMMLRLSPILNTEDSIAVLSNGHKRNDMKNSIVLGTMSYHGIKYNVVLSEKGIARCSVNVHDAFDLLETDNIDSSMSFMRINAVLSPGNYAPIANMAFEPDFRRLSFLTEVGKKLKETTPALERIALAYQPSRESKWEYKLL